MRKFVVEEVFPEAIKCEEKGTRIPQSLVDRLGYVMIFLTRDLIPIQYTNRELNIIAMRIGPGKHLKGRTLMGGAVTPEEFSTLR